MICYTNLETRLETGLPLITCSTSSYSLSYSHCRVTSSWRTRITGRPAPMPQLTASDLFHPIPSHPISCTLVRGQTKTTKWIIHRAFRAVCVHVSETSAGAWSVFSTGLYLRALPNTTEPHGRPWSEPIDASLLDAHDEKKKRILERRLEGQKDKGKSTEVAWSREVRGGCGSQWAEQINRERERGKKGREAEWWQKREGGRACEREGEHYIQSALTNQP